MQRNLILTLTFLLFTGVSTSFAQPFAEPVGMDDCETVPGDPTVSTPCQAGGNPEVYQAIEFILSSVGQPSLGLTANADTDPLQIVGNPGYWNQLGGGTPSNVAVIAIGANNTNTLGAYEFGDPAGMMDIAPAQSGFMTLGTGSFADPFPGGEIVFPANFGFALTSKDSRTGASETWYSDPTLNSDGFDHMLSFHLPQLDGTSVWIDMDEDGISDHEVVFGKNAFLLAWEDRAANHPSFDNDFNDTFFLISRISTPTTATPVPEPLSLALLSGGIGGLLLGKKKKIIG